jgi:uncharacterized protein (DUF427 family)
MLVDVARPHRIEPGPGQESVWDYPRPPRVERTSRRLVVVVAGRTIADTTAGWRVLETSQPPAFYLPSRDVDLSCLVLDRDRTWCEWKGTAQYWSIVVPDRAGAAGGRPDVRPGAAWSYPRPNPGYEAITDHLAFYPQRVDACYVDDERVLANEGDFYGGWITSSVVGPFKGGAGSRGW